MNLCNPTEPCALVMKRLLQRIEDGLYYQGKGAWTKEQTGALIFNDVNAAMACCRKDGLPPTYYLLKFSDSKWDAQVPCCGVEANPS